MPDDILQIRQLKKNQKNKRFSTIIIKFKILNFINLALDLEFMFRVKYYNLKRYDRDLKFKQYNNYQGYEYLKL